MKNIVAVWHSGGKGKTETLRELANLLIKTYPNIKAIYPNLIKIPAKYDFRLVVEINGIIVGIESQGDPNTQLEKRLDELAKTYKCDLIFCATRTKGKTVKAVEKVAREYSFNEIWTSTHQTSVESNYAMFNHIKAQHLLDLVQQLDII